MQHVISLSTIPPRFDKLGPVLTALVGQSSRPRAVELYIPQSYRRFPQWGGALPEVPDGVTIVRTESDLGPATKILPAAKAWRGQEVELIYVDDDQVMSRHWVRDCLRLRQSHPGEVICGAGFNIRDYYGYDFLGDKRPRAAKSLHPHYQFTYQFGRVLRALGGAKSRAMKPYMHRFGQSGYVDIAEGYGGVMIRPEFLDAEAYDIPAVIWAVDDIWLSGHYARLGIPIWGEKRLFKAREVMESSYHFALGRSVIEGADRQGANRACIDHMRDTYGIWGGVATQST